MSEYWEKYWRGTQTPQSEDLQRQVGRTVNKKPIDSEIWERTVEFISDQMGLKADSDVLDLCAGNGLLSIPFAKIARGVTAVDICEPLLNNLAERAKEEKADNITIINNNILNSEFPAGTFSHIVMYFSLQHFSERETLLIFEKARDWLNNGGVFYIGDIPDAARLWEFADGVTYEDMYFDALKNDTPAIGTWFSSVYLLKMARYAGFSEAEYIAQPEWQINSRYRFDLILKKQGMRAL